MKKQISRFSVHQTSKMIAVLYFVLIAIFAIPLGILALVNPKYAPYSPLMCFLLPFIYLIFTYLITAFLLSIYNLLAKTLGGIEFTLKDREENFIP